MRKIIFAGIMSLSLAGCATMMDYRDKAVAFMCEHKLEIYRGAIALGDMQTIQVLDIYCPLSTDEIAIVASKTADELEK